jgi:UDP-glucose 4-epimerase
MKKILITGGSGFIGSHTALAFLEAGIDVVILDNLSNSHTTTLGNMSAISGKKLTLLRVMCSTMI